MSDDARSRPRDPAGTQPRHDPRSLLPSEPSPVPLMGAEREREREPEPAPHEAAEEGAGAARAPRHSRYAPRFQFLTGALVAIALTALVVSGAYLLAPDEGDTDGRPWSSWRPTAEGLAGARQIAEHVGPRYRDKGVQLVQVRARDLEFGGTPLSVVLRLDAQRGGDIREVEGDALIYELCGLGPRCAIDRGKPSAERGALIRREALELALYSFRYLDVEQVLVQLPPLPGDDPMRLLRFGRDALQAALSRPLTSTLAPSVPSLRRVLEAPDTSYVDRIALNNLFLFTLAGASFDDQGYIVLDPYSEAEERKRQRAARAARAAALAAESSTSRTTP